MQNFKGSGADYIFSDPNTYPDGLDVEVFTRTALEKSNGPDLSVLQREHVTVALRESGLFLVSNFKNDVDYSNLRLCLDEAKDLELLTEIFQYFEPNIFFSWNEVVKLSESHPNIFSKNSHIPRNEGKNMSKGQKLWKRAKELIPGGGMLLSKRPETFLPGLWPAYFTRASGCNVWDLDGRQFIDMSLMGVGTNILGYGKSGSRRSCGKSCD